MGLQGGVQDGGIRTADQQLGGEDGQLEQWK